ncbi:MAG: type II toxin-antitoxin system VapC family toxin [Planctomycetota bacterium]
MLFDTDILIWILRGNARAAQTVDDAAVRLVSIVSYMELLQGAHDKRELLQIRKLLSDTGCRLVPLSENIGLRASVYMEEQVLKNRLSMGDALVAATAVETQAALCTGNARHLTGITELDIKLFRP